MFLLAAALTAIEIIALHTPLHHVQGIDVEKETLWVSSVERSQKKGFLFRLDRRTGRLLAQVEVQDGERFHPGGLTLDGDHLWLPVAEYRRTSSTVVQLRDKNTLRLIRQFAVPDHIGCIAASGNRLYGGNWDSLDLYTWDKDGRQLAKRKNLSGTRFQDLKWIRGLLVGGGLREKGRGAIDWLHPESLQLQRRIDVETTDRGVVLTNEGMTIRSELLYLLPEDDPSRLFVFQAPSGKAR